jgi:hypothetical protein
MYGIGPLSFIYTSIYTSKSWGDDRKRVFSGGARGAFTNVVRKIAGGAYYGSSLIGELSTMSKFKVGDRVRILPGTAIPFVGVEGTIYGVQPHDGGITTMDRHIVVFERREKRSFYSSELQRIEKVK